MKVHASLTLIFKRWGPLFLHMCLPYYAWKNTSEEVSNRPVMFQDLSVNQ